MKLEGAAEDLEPSGWLEPIFKLQIYLPLGSFTSVLSSYYVPGPAHSTGIKVVVITTEKQIGKYNVAL